MSDPGPPPPSPPRTPCGIHRWPLPTGGNYETIYQTGRKAGGLFNASLSTLYRPGSMCVCTLESQGRKGLPRRKPGFRFRVRLGGAFQF